MAIAMASSERSATGEDVWKACIICKTYQPHNGKFLSCLHVVCAGCLGECTSRDGSVFCFICKSSTSAQVAGVELAKQLPNSFDFLHFDEAPKVETSIPSDGVSRTKSTAIALCHTCSDMDAEKEASHECADWNGLPLCESHAETHPKKRAYSEYHVNLCEGRTSSHKRTSSSSSKRCMYHSKCNVVTYCQTCSQCICVECIDAGRHDEHVMESIASAAAKQRTRVAEVFQAAGLDLIMTNEIIDITTADCVTTTATTTATTTTPMDTSANIIITSSIVTNMIMPAEELLTVISRNIAIATEEASVSSKMATGSCDTIKKMGKQQSERILNDIATAATAATCTTEPATTDTMTTFADTSGNIAVAMGDNDTNTMTSRLMPAGKLLAAIDRSIAMVTEESSVASKVATKRFDKIEKIVKLQRERILSDIDHRLWNQLDPLEAKKRRLESLLQRQAAVVEVATRLSSPSVCPEGVLQVANTVVENALSISQGIQAEQIMKSTPLLSVESAPLDGAQSHLEQVVRVRDRVRMDISKSVVDLSGRELQVGYEDRVVVKLADPNGRRIPSDQPTPDIIPAIILPSGERQTVQVSSLESDSSKLVIPISATEPGTITLELSSQGVSFQLRSLVSPSIFFDPRKCHNTKVLSNNNRVVTHSPAIGSCNVLATEEYTTGRHEWAVRVIKGGVGVEVGISPAPSDGNYYSTAAFFGDKAPGWRSWSAYGAALRYHSTTPFYTLDESAEMQEVIDGDILVFTLNCDARTLHCINQYTQEAKTFTGIDCSQRLYPAVSMCREGQSVEIIQHSYSHHSLANSA